MPKASPIVKAFNAGEYSKLMEGRIDFAKYPASMRKALNCAVTPQGPALCRPGTAMEAPVFNETLQSYLIPFVFSNTQSMQVEFANLRVRFHSEAGILSYPSVGVTLVVGNAYTAPGHGAVAGDQVVLSGFDFTTNLNGRVGNVTAVAGDIVTTDIPVPAHVGSLATAKLSRVYSIVSPYTDADVVNLRYTSDQDGVYLFCPKFPIYQLLRLGVNNWTLTKQVLIDGPFGDVNTTTTTLTADGDGNMAPFMTANNVPAGTVIFDTETAGNDGFKAFDGDPATWWEPTSANGTGYIGYEPTAPQIARGYTIYVPETNGDVSYTDIDHAPGNFTFEGYDGSDWFVLDRQIGYVLYDGNRSAYFPIQNAVAYQQYRLNISANVRNGPINPRVSGLRISCDATSEVNIVASATTGINTGNVGFLATDIGRMLRLTCTDGFARPVLVTARTDATHIKVKIQADCLSDLQPMTQWRLGLISDTTGYPTCGAFYQDRFFIGGIPSFPSTVIASVTGKYLTFTQTEPGGQVAADNALILVLKVRKQGVIGWIDTDGSAILIGTSAGVYSIVSSDNTQGLSALTAKAQRATVRGVAPMANVIVDSNLLFAQFGNRTVRETVLDFYTNNYKTPSKSLYSSHLGVPKFQQMDYAPEPHSIVFVRRGDGTVAALTYNKDENVDGWFTCDFADGFVECISVIPSADGTYDQLWMIVRRIIDGVTRRFIEYMTAFWDFGNAQEDAWFVDCGVQYNGPPITDVYGLYNYNGAQIVGLADGSPIVPVTVVDGHIALPDAASKITLGLQYDLDGETSRLEAGAADGTAQGKKKRFNRIIFRLWDTGGGSFAVRSTEREVEDGDYVDFKYLDPQDELDVAQPLFTGDYETKDMPQSYTTDASILFRRTGDVPLPFNLIAIMPQLKTEDDG